MSTAVRTPSASAGVQSLHRALDVVEAVAARGGTASLAEVAADVTLPQPTTHRLLRTLLDRGYVRQLPDRRYALGFRLVPLGASASALTGAGAEAVLSDLVRDIGETANLAVLSGSHAEYVAQAPSAYSMRMFTEVGRRVELHCTGVGKALLAALDDASALALVAPLGLPARTPHSVTSSRALLAALADVRERGFALDEQEQELGVRCVAVRVASVEPGLALSVSGPVTRMTDDVVASAVPLLHAAATRLAHDLTSTPTEGP